MFYGGLMVLWGKSSHVFTWVIIPTLQGDVNACGEEGVVGILGAGEEG